jgi:hypothetical protein
MSDGSAIGGSIDPKAFPFLLMDLHRNGATGSLKVEGPSYQKALYFRSGRILFGSSNDPRDQLGAILIESGKITPEQLEDVNSKVGPGSPLAKVLAESGIVSQRELGEAARAKVERILSDVITYDDGGFEFEDGVLPKGAVDLKLSTEKLILAAVRRIGDRAFVLRYLEGLEVLLQPSPDLEARLGDALSETGGLAEQLDGSRTLKEAAAAAGLDEFDAGKVACALLFLGVLERQGAAAEQEAPLFVPPEPDSGGELDLSQTARFALSQTPEAPPSEPEPAPAPVPEPTEQPMFVAPAAEEPPAEPDAPVWEPPPPESQQPASPSMPDFSVPSEPEPEAPIVPAPPPEPEPPPQPPPPPEPIRPRPSRPSEADLEALDTLLGGREPEGPLEPLERRTQPRWEPQFGAHPRGRRSSGGGGKSVLIGLFVVVVIAAAGAAGWYFWLEPQSRRAASNLPSSAGPVPTAAAAPSTALAPPTTSPGAGAAPASGAEPAPPTAAPPTTTPAATAPAAAPTAVPSGATPARATPTRAATPRPSRPQTSSDPEQALGNARESLKAGRLSDAAQDFVASLRAQPAESHSIQVLLACSPETVQKAARNVPDDRLFIVPFRYRGRDCHRICWGVYAGQAEAEKALSTVPAYFREGGSKPRVVAVSGLL